MLVIFLLMKSLTVNKYHKEDVLILVLAYVLKRYVRQFRKGAIRVFRIGPGRRTCTINTPDLVLITEMKAKYYLKLKTRFSN